MSSRTHSLDNGKTRIKATAGRIWIPAVYEDWSAKLTRKVKVKKVVWWNPFSWFTKTHWKRAGNIPAFPVRFIGLDGKAVSPSRVNPKVTSRKGLRKVTVFYGQIGYSGGQTDGTVPPPEVSEPIDARAVEGVEMDYIINGQTRTLTNP